MLYHQLRRRIIHEILPCYSYAAYEKGFLLNGRCGLRGCPLNYEAGDIWGFYFADCVFAAFIILCVVVECGAKSKFDL